ncbi:hypothetical protein [Xanthomonas hortorum]|uniref:hypothetical protein n=1 Tax=Xanthomonas TaxID=338 RepID=UPI002B25C739|nr:hypothetical protein [Xanthomonas hortorum]
METGLFVIKIAISMIYLRSIREYRRNFVMRSRLAVLAILVAVGSLVACSTAPTPPPEPNMSKLVPVNKTMPSELYSPASSAETVKGGR